MIPYTTDLFHNELNNDTENKSIDDDIIFSDQDICIIVFNNGIKLITYYYSSYQDFDIPVGFSLLLYPHLYEELTLTNDTYLFDKYLPENKNSYILLSNKDLLTIIEPKDELIDEYINHLKVNNLIEYD